jgi:dihydropteroate synthase
MYSENPNNSYLINCKGKLYDLSTPKIMGIINCTPDSFYENSRFSQKDELMSKVQSMVSHGAEIIDIGGASTRPGAIFPTIKEEKTRVIDILKFLKKEFPTVLFSIDTMYSEVAQEAVDVGADIINDVSGAELDSTILDVAAKNKVSYVLTHSPGFIRSVLPFESESFMLDLISYLSQKINVCKEKGIVDLIIDPGFGFAKSLEQNFEIVRKFEMLKIFDSPILVGISRKSMIYKTLNKSPETVLNGTTVLNTLLYLKGAKIIRVHDVEEMTEVKMLLASN